MRTIIGIDPPDAMAFLGMDRRIIALVRIPSITVGKTRQVDAPKCHQILKPNSSEAIVYIEDYIAFPGQDVRATATTVGDQRFLCGMLAGLQIPYVLVKPAVWRRAVCSPLPKLDKDLSSYMKRKLRKEHSLAVAKQLFPRADLGKDDHMAEALLIAEYGRRKEQGT